MFLSLLTLQSGGLKMSINREYRSYTKRLPRFTVESVLLLKYFLSPLQTDHFRRSMSQNLPDASPEQCANKF
jgi:hypothetical protein